MKTFASDRLLPGLSETRLQLGVVSVGYAVGLRSLWGTFVMGSSLGGGMATASE